MLIQGGIKADAFELPPSGFIKIGDAVFYLAGSNYGVLLNVRTRVTLAEMNAGKTLLTPAPSVRFRLVYVTQTSIGGNMAATAAATGTAIYCTQAGSSVALYSVLLAAGTQSTICYPGLANTSILADGASFARNDPGASVTCKATSAGAFDLVTATHFDINLLYCLEV